MQTHSKEAFKKIAPMIGNTPLLQIHCTHKGLERCIYAKAEYYNLTGSIKDRIAYDILYKAYETGEITEKMPIAEATSGNTGISFAAMGAVLGNPVEIFMPDWMSRERIAMIESFGAKIHLVSKEQGGFLGSIEKTQKLAEDGSVFLPKQFSNAENSEAHYLGTGKEIADVLQKLGKKADAFVAGVGTGGTVMGISRRLKEVNPGCKAFALEPLNSPTLSTGYKVGKHRIQGISDDFIPDLLDLQSLDGIVSVDDGDAIIAAQMLAKQLGIGVGISSGANFIGALMAAEALPDDAVVVTVFSDDNKKYLSTDYTKTEPAKPDFYTNDLVLRRVAAYKG